MTARATDPDTSHAAAALVAPVAGRIQAAILSELRHRRLILSELRGASPDPAGEGLTAWDLTRRLRARYGITCEQNSVAKRLSELRDKGLVVATGERRKGRTSAKLTVWALPTGDCEDDCQVSCTHHLNECSTGEGEA